MNNISLFENEGTWFARHMTFMLPAFDGPPKFDIRVAMVSVGAVQSKTASTWKTSLTVIEVAAYLSSLQTSKLGPGAARRAWLMAWKLGKIAHTPPFTFEGDVDWTALRLIIEKEIAAEFPLCA